MKQSVCLIYLPVAFFTPLSSSFFLLLPRRHFLRCVFSRRAPQAVFFLFSHLSSRSSMKLLTDEGKAFEMEISESTFQRQDEAPPPGRAVGGLV